MLREQRGTEGVADGDKDVAARKRALKPRWDSHWDLPLSFF